MKESEENLNSDFSLKVKHDISDRLRTEAPVLPNPSPIFAAPAEKKKFPLLLALGVAAAVSLVINIFLGISVAKINTDNKVLETEVEKNKETIKNLRVRLNESGEDDL